MIVWKDQASWICNWAAKKLSKYAYQWQSRTSQTSHYSWGKLFMAMPLTSTPVVAIIVRANQNIPRVGLPSTWRTYGRICNSGHGKPGIQGTQLSMGQWSSEEALYSQVRSFQCLKISKSQVLQWIFTQPRLDYHLQQFGSASPWDMKNLSCKRHRTGFVSKPYRLSLAGAPLLQFAVRSPHLQLLELEYALLQVTPSLSAAKLNKMTAIRVDEQPRKKAENFDTQMPFTWPETKKWNRNLDIVRRKEKGRKHSCDADEYKNQNQNQTHTWFNVWLADGSPLFFDQSDFNNNNNNNSS